MKQVIKSLFFFLLLLAGGINNAYAGEKVNVVKQGAVRGRIVDTGNQTLPGASIYIENLQTGVTSDINGFYTFSNLEPGTYTFKISYVGYSPVEVEVKIPEGKTLERDVVLNEGIQLQEVVVGGAFDGQRRAINAQKSNLAVTNIVSADQVGKFPDSNIGDALKRISGINVQYDQGEARFGQVRGTSADLSSVTINGNRIPSAEGDTRNVQLDLIPADMIQVIEVNKVVTPDMEGDAIGGSINLVTRNSPYRRTVSAIAGSGWNWVSNRAQLNLGLVYGERFFNNKLGVIIAASYQYAPSGSDDVEFAWEKDGDKVYLNDYQIRRYYVTRERQSYSAAFDWSINESHKLTFKSIFNNRNDWENRYRMTLKDLDEDGNATVRIQTKGGTPDNKNARLERQRTMDFTLGGEHLFDKLDVDWNVSYAEAGEIRPNERYIDFQLKKQQFNADLSDRRKPFYTPREGSTLIFNDKFSLKELTEEQEDIQERDLKLSLNFELPLALGKYGNKIKFGGKLIRKSKDKEKDFYEYEPLGGYEDQFLNGSFSNTGNQNKSGFMAGSKYQAGDFIDKRYLGGLDLNNSTLFDKEQVVEEIAASYEARETVTAGYIRFDQKIGRKLDVMAGLRVEDTRLRYTGRIYDADEDKTTTSPQAKEGYTNLLPSLLLKYNVSDEFKVRASFTHTIARPKYSALVPSMNVNRGDNEITIGNPGLKPTKSYNVDLNGEYYFRSVGLMSAGVFYKKIEDFMVDQNLKNYTYEGHVYTTFTQPRNAGNANLLGFEVAFQRDLGFVTPVLKCLGVYGNYTYTYTRVNDFNFEGREQEKGLRLPGSPEHTANASLYFERKGVNARLSYNYASSFIDEMGAEKFYDRYYDAVGYLDLNVSYTFAKHYTLYAEANNLLNQPLRYYQGEKAQTMQAEYYGAKVNLGFKVNF